MASCRTCRQYFHTCINCVYEHEWQRFYCCEECWKEEMKIKEEEEKFIEVFGVQGLAALARREQLN